MDLTRKASLVVGGHQTNPPNESTYSSVVSRDSIQIAFMLAALNDLDVLSADVQGAYLNTPTKEKVHATNSTPSHSNAFHHHAYMALSDYQATFHGPQAETSWPDTNTPQMEINRALQSNYFLPTPPQAPPNTGSTELFPDDPLSTHVASCHYTRFQQPLRH